MCVLNRSAPPRWAMRAMFSTADARTCASKSWSNDANDSNTLLRSFLREESWNPWDCATTENSFARLFRTLLVIRFECKREMREEREGRMGCRM